MKSFSEMKLHFQQKHINTLVLYVVELKGKKKKIFLWGSGIFNFKKIDYFMLLFMVKIQYWRRFTLKITAFIKRVKVVRISKASRWAKYVTSTGTISYVYDQHHPNTLNISNTSTNHINIQSFVSLIVESIYLSL